MVHKRSPPSWADYRIRTRLFWVLFLFGPIVALGTGALWLVERFGLHGLGWPLVAWVVAMLLATWHWQSFRCPRCERRFFNRQPFLLALRAKRCVHCMMSKD